MFAETDELEDNVIKGEVRVTLLLGEEMEAPLFRVTEGAVTLIAPLEETVWSAPTVNEVPAVKFRTDEFD